jgi:crotonobetainyl-CoA:carnitine CoA-transferase CaiB-like acyl-CoA transferase
LATVSIPAGVAIRPVDLLADPEVRRSDTFHEYKVLDGGSCFAPGRLAHFSRTQKEGVLFAPGLGEHSREILAQAGYSESDVDRLLADHVVVEEGPLLLPRLEAYR